MEKIAVLILAHRNPNQLHRLINKFDSELFDIYIHVDKKVNFDEYYLEKNNCYFIDSRVDVKWGGFSLCEATINLLEVASKKEYVHYYLMSGSDYLLKSSEELYNYLVNNKKYNFNTSIKTTGFYNKRYEIKYRPWLSNNNFICKVIKNLYMIITGGRTHTFNLFKLEYKTNFKVSFASEWFCYNHDAVTYILNYLSQNKEYSEFMKSTLVPDEMFFISILTNSSYSKTIREGLTYVDWSENKRSPKTFTRNDLEDLKESNYFVARKFDENYDSEILDLLDEVN